MFSLAEHHQLSESQLSAGAILHPSDHFSSYHRYILSEFHVCCGNEKKIRKRVYFLFSPVLIFTLQFLYCLPADEFCRTVSWVSWGFRGLPGARTSLNLKGALCLVDGKSRLIPLSASLLFSCNSKQVCNHPTSRFGLFPTSSFSSSQGKLKSRPSNPR